VIPYIPESITVHLGAPSVNAANVTVPFVDYVKNVAASEIYPTWDESALRANILAITSFALNRVYTEYYRSRSYAFDITSSTAYDQSFVNGRSTFESTDRLVDELFNDYIRRQGFVEPLAAKFCNGTTVTCEGLSQWGSQRLAEQGYNSVEILRSYYGQDIELVADAPVAPLTSSYPGTALRRGDSGPNVTLIQSALNRISQNYPAIPKINPVDGIFGSQTETAVVRFQEIFDLSADGIVGKATWYAIVRLYVAVTSLAELRSEGQTFYGISWEYPDAIVRGDSGEKVSHLQYMLSVLAEFIDEIPPLTVSGDFDDATYQAVVAFQRYVGLPDNGVVGSVTWDAIYRQFAGIEQTVFDDAALFPFNAAEQTASLRTVQQELRTISAAGTGITAPQTTGQLDRQTVLSLTQFQRRNGLLANGRPDENTRRALADAAQNLAYCSTSRLTQYPGFDLRLGNHDDRRDFSWAML
jgi:peptidoglycan hydrolase-like protein with peptidoglycan-binding domain